MCIRVCVAGAWYAMSFSSSGPLIREAQVKERKYNHENIRQGSLYFLSS